MAERTGGHKPSPGCLYSCSSKGGLAPGLLCPQMPVQCPSFSAGGGHFESYCSSQACQGALSWGRDPDEVSTYGFLLDLGTSYPLFPLHICLQFLCSAAQHRPEDTPALPRESTNPGAAGWLLGMGLKALDSCGLMSLVVLP